MTGWTKDTWRTLNVGSDRWSRRTGEKVSQREQVAEQEQDKKVRFREEEQPEETRAQSTNEQGVSSGFEDVRTGTGRAGLVRGGDERCRTDETTGEGEGKGNGGEEEHGGKGKLGSKEARQDGKQDEEDDLVQVAPNMEGGGSYPEAMADPEEECGSARKKQHSEAREEKLRWADCFEEELGKREESEEEEKKGSRRSRTSAEEGKLKGSLQKEEELRAKVERNMRRKGERRRRGKKEGSEKSVRKKGERKRREKSKRKR